MTELEAPDGDEPNWDLLYHARGEEVNAARPLFTGDIFTQVPVPLADDSGGTKNRTVMVIQHPCAMRTDGINLIPRLLVTDVRDNRLLEPGEWAGYGKLFPLPDLRPDRASRARHGAAFFDELFLVSTGTLLKRIACLSQLGIDLLLQRWVHHNSRVIVESFKFHEATGGIVEECDLIEEWCDTRAASAVGPVEAMAECVNWLRESAKPGSPRQELIRSPQNRSAVRREMRAHLASLGAGEAPDIQDSSDSG